MNNDHWYGHDQPNLKRFHLDHPFERSRFEHFGPNYRYSIVRFDRDHHRFWLPRGYYQDPDYPGWYMLYNVHTGQYVHAAYLGV